MKLFQLSACFLLLAGLSGCGDGNDTSVSPQPPDNAGGNVITGLVSLDDLQPGMCADIVDEIHGIEYLTVKDCTEAHHYEFAGTAALDDLGEDYPGGLYIERAAYRRCRSAFEEHTGQAYNGRDLGIEVITPSVSSWQAGDSTALCFVVNADRSPLMSAVKS